MIDKVKELREKTGLGVMDCKKALEEANGNFAKALELLKERAKEILAKKSGRETNQGIIDAYVHDGKIGVLVELTCETDFVAKNEEFKKLAHEIALQVAGGQFENTQELLDSPFFKEPSIKIEDMVTEIAAKVGENVQIKRFVKYELGN